MSNIFLDILGIEINFKDQATILAVNAHKTALLAKIDSLIKSSTEAESLEKLIKKYPGIPQVISIKQKAIADEAEKRIKEIAAAELEIQQITKSIDDIKADFNLCITFAAIKDQRKALLKKLSTFEQTLIKAHAVLNKGKPAQNIESAITKKQDEIIYGALQASITMAENIQKMKETDQTRYQLTKEDMLLLIANKNKKRAFNCFVIDIETTVALSGFLETVKKNGQSRTQLLYRMNKHWSAMDIQRDNDGKLKIFVIDAANYRYNQLFIASICATLQIAVVFCAGNLQDDVLSCSIFAMDHAFHMSKIPDLHAQIDKVKVKDGNWDFAFRVDPIHLPAVLVKNVQVSSFHTTYIETNKAQAAVKINKKGQTLEQYIEAHKVKDVLAGIGYKQKQYRDKVNRIKLQALAVAPANEGDRVVVVQPVVPNLRARRLQSSIAVVGKGLTMFAIADANSGKVAAVPGSSNLATLT